MTHDPSAYGPYCFQNRYGVIQAGVLPFSAGGLFYFHRRAITRWINDRLPVLAIALAILIGAMFAGPIVTTTIGPFLGIPLMLIALALAGDYQATRTQDFFGRSSYHLFIAHMPLGAVLATGLHLKTDSATIYSVALCGAIGLSGFLVPLERQIEKLRKRVISGARQGRSSVTTMLEAETPR